jgi:ATP-dependent RNA helicase RhlB
VYALAGIEKYINMKIPVAPVSDDILVQDKSKGMRIQLSTWDEEGNETGFQPARGRGGPRDARGGRDGRDARGPHGHGDQRDPRHGGRPETAGGDRRPDGRGGNRPAGQRPAQERPAEVRAPRGDRPAAHKAGGMSVEERLAFYRQKYGESFQATPELMEKLRREEQRAKEHAKPDHGGNRSGRTGSGHPRGGERRQEGKRPANSGRPAPVAGAAAPERRPVAQAAAQSTKKTPQGGILGWIKGLFRGTKQP